MCEFKRNDEPSNVWAKIHSKAFLASALEWKRMRVARVCAYVCDLYVCEIKFIWLTSKALAHNEEKEEQLKEEDYGVLLVSRMCV